MQPQWEQQTRVVEEEVPRQMLMVVGKPVVQVSSLSPTLPRLTLPRHTQVQAIIHTLMEPIPSWYSLRLVCLPSGKTASFS